MFCPHCKSLMISSAGQLKCKRCGYIRDITGADQMTIEEKRSEKEIIFFDEEQELATKPTFSIKCPECEHNLAFWWMRQLRSADESEVRFFKCVKCGYTWREYD